MATYKLEVIRRGTIIVDDVEDLEHAEEYIEGCNPVDDVEWSDYLQVTGGTKLKIIQIPYDFIQVKKIAEILDEPVGQIISKLFLNGRVVEENTCISFETAKELAEKYDVLLKKEFKVKQKYIRQLKLKFEMHIIDMKIKLLQLRKLLVIVELKLICLAKYIFIEFWEERV